MAAVTISNVRRIGNVSHIRGRAVLVQVTHNTSYATGGDDLPIASLRGLNTVDAIMKVTGPTTTRFKGKAVTLSTCGASVRFAGTPTAPKIQLFVGAATPTEVANATNMATVTYDLVVVGR